MSIRSDSDYAEWKDWSAHGFGQFDRREARYFELETAVSDRANVLEVGFGNGQFLAWARAQGAQVWGVELDPVLVARARQKFGADSAFGSLFDTGLDLLRGQLSHVLAFDVIEHVAQQELPCFVARMAEFLAPDGRIVLRFPNGDSPFGRIHQHGDPTHQTTLGRGKLEYFARSAGLEVCSVRAPALPVRGMGTRIALRRLLLRAGRAVIERAVATLYFGGRRVPLDPDCVAVLRRPAARSLQRQAT